MGKWRFKPTSSRLLSPQASSQKTKTRSLNQLESNAIKIIPIYPPTHLPAYIGRYVLMTNCFLLHWSNHVKRPLRNLWGKFDSTQVHKSQEPVWPELAKFRHFSKLSKILDKLLSDYFVFGKKLNLLWQYYTFWANLSCCE